MPEDMETKTVRYNKYAPTGKKAFGLIDVALLTLLITLALGLRLWNLDQPAEQYFDEIYYVDAATKLLAGQPDPNSVHPPLGKWLIGLGMKASSKAFGSTISPMVKWRLASVLAGTASVFLTYQLGLFLFSYNRVAAGLAGLIVATEHLHLTCSRIAMLDPFVALFSLLGLTTALYYFQSGHQRWAIMSAFSFGLATGCKWSGLFTAIGCIVVGWWLCRPQQDQTRTQHYIFWLILGIPLGFFLSYAHLFILDGFHLSTFKEIFGQGEKMVHFRADAHQFTHRYLSYFWSWPLMAQPIWFFFKQDKSTHTVQAICAMGTPVFWWGFLILLGTQLVAALKSRASYTRFRAEQPMVGALIILWFCQWLPWAVSYTGGFFYYMLTEVPIMALLVGKVLAELLNFQDALGEGRWRGWTILGAYFVAAALYYPFAVAQTVPRSYFNRLFFAQWIVGNPNAAPAKDKTKKKKDVTALTSPLVVPVAYQSFQR